MASLTPRIDNIEGSRNLQINGDFTFWQRGTTFNSVANGTYTADRFRTVKVTTGALQNLTRSTDVPTVAQSGYKSLYSLLMTQTATTDASIASNDLVGIRTILEGHDYAVLHRKSYALQFWVKASLPGNYGLGLTSAGSARRYGTFYNVAAANTWEKKTINVAAESSDTGWLFDAGVGLIVDFGLMVGTNYQGALNTWEDAVTVAAGPSGTSLVNFAGTSGATWQISQMMIVPATLDSAAEISFKRAGKTTQEELAMCLRYFEKSFALDVAPALNLGDTRPVYGLEGRRIPFSVPKRSAPNMTAYSALSANAGQWHWFSGAWNLYTPNFGGTDALTWSVSGQGAATVAGHWSADAEL